MYQSSSSTSKEECSKITSGRKPRVTSSSNSLTSAFRTLSSVLRSYLVLRSTRWMCGTNLNSKLVTFDSWTRQSRSCPSSSRVVWLSCSRSITAHLGMLSLALKLAGRVLRKKSPSRPRSILIIFSWAKYWRLMEFSRGWSRLTTWASSTTTFSSMRIQADMSLQTRFLPTSWAFVASLEWIPGWTRWTNHL